MNILGISCFYHDSAACLVRDGTILAGALEEIFIRKKGKVKGKKNNPRFPGNVMLNEAIANLLEEALGDETAKRLCGGGER